MGGAAQSVYYVSTEPIAEGSDDGQVTSPIREAGNASVMTYLRKEKKTAGRSLFFSGGVVGLPLGPLPRPGPCGRGCLFGAGRDHVASNKNTANSSPIWSPDEINLFSAAKLYKNFSPDGT